MDGFIAVSSSSIVGGVGGGTVVVFGSNIYTCTRVWNDVRNGWGEF